MDTQSYLETLIEPLHFYAISLDRYSLVGNTPKNVKPDVLQAIAGILVAVLANPQGEGQASNNHAHAIILLWRHQALFKKHGINLPPSKFLNIIQEKNDRQLTLDCKRHVGNHSIDESKLTDLEFFEYYHIYTGGLTSKQLKLLRRYKQFRDWTEYRRT